MPIVSGDDVEEVAQLGFSLASVLASHLVKKSDAKTLYDDVTPKPTAEEVEMRRVERLYRAASRAAGTPDRDQRRELRRLKERN